MKEDLIRLDEYCEKSCAEINFMLSLEEEGLIEIYDYEENKYIDASQLSDIDLFLRLYDELSINLAGIDVINNLLIKIRLLEKELYLLQKQAVETEIDFFEDV